jgi:hypothetical protein
VSNQLISVFPRTDLRCGHDGLTTLARKAKRDPSTLAPGQFMVFINNSQSAFKMFAANNTLVYYRSPRGRIDINTIRHIPNCFNGNALNYNAALKKSLTELLARKKRNGI